jgi:hypothetical protein
VRRKISLKMLRFSATEPFSVIEEARSRIQSPKIPCLTKTCFMQLQVLCHNLFENEIVDILRVLSEYAVFSSHRPSEFPRAVTLCTSVMGLLYGTVGVIGYWSRGDAIDGIVIFSLGDSPQVSMPSMS